MFTNEQIKEIRDKLALIGMKDSALPSAIIPLIGTEEASFVQNGSNVKMRLTDIVNHLLLYRATDFINISEKFDNQEFTLEEAIATISPVNRKAGVAITYIDSTTHDWTIYQFKGPDETEWFNLGLWDNILAKVDNHFKGFFVNEAALLGEYPRPTIGDYAFVGTEFNTAIIYRCITRWTWTQTSELAKDYTSIIVTGAVSIGSNGNWFNDGVDTGIKASGEDGLTPIFRWNNNVLEYSYNGADWVAISQPLTKVSVGLSNVDNTSDLDKPISNATLTELNKKDTIVRVNSELAKKIDKTSIVDNLLSIDGTVPVSARQAKILKDQVDSIANGAPSGVYDTLPLLQAAFPTGNDNIYLVKGNIKEVDTLTITAIPTVAGNITITLNGIDFNVAVDPITETTIDLVAAKIRNAIFTDWAITGLGATVIFTANIAEPKTPPVFNGNTTGVTGNFVRTTIGVAPDGFWYYWNGTAWTPGALYQVSTDTSDEEEVIASDLNQLAERVNALELLFRNMTLSKVQTETLDVLINLNFQGRPLIIVATTAPSAAPDGVPQFYVNTTTGDFYSAKGSASSGDWILK